MAGIPESIVAIADLDEIDDALPTASARVFLAPDGSRSKADVWLVRAAKRLWLAAAVDDHCWTRGVAAASDAAVTPGLTRDTVRVGPYTMPLRRRTRAEVERVVEAFSRAADGKTLAPPPPVRAGRAIDGAHGIPDWWCETVGGEEPWWFVFRTATSYPLFDFGGAVRDEPLHVGISATTIVVAAHFEPGVSFVEPIEGVAEHLARLGDDDVQIGQWRLTAKDESAALITALARHEPALRLATLLDHALDLGAIRAAAAYASELREQNGAANAAVSLAYVTHALDAPDHALTHLLRADRLPSLADATEHYARVAKAIAGADDETRQLLDAAALVVEPLGVSAPRDFPWPPASLAELLSAANALRGQSEEALRLLETTEEPRRTHARLTIGEADAEAWRVVANQYAERQAYPDARHLIERAIEQEATSTDHVLAAAWAWMDDDADDAARAFEAALSVGLDAAKDPSDIDLLASIVDIAPSADLDSPGLLERAKRVLARSETSSDESQRNALLALADVAERAGYRDEAATLIVRHEAARTSSREQITESANRCHKALAAPQHAAQLLESLAQRIEQASEEETATLWLRAGALRAEADAPKIALDNLRAALASEFLRPDNYRTALATTGITLEPTLERWWKHLHAVMAGEDAAPAPLEPVTSLDAEQLDALHPGGVGWLDNLRHAIQEVERPERATLVRGLEQLTAERYQKATTIIQELSAALGIEAPDCFLCRGDDAHGVCVWPIDEPVLLLGFQHLDEDPCRLSERALRFLLAVELTHLACQHPILAFESDFLGTSHSVYRAFGKYAGAAETVVDVVTMLPGVDQIAKLQRVIRFSRRVFSTKAAVDKVTDLAAPLAKFFQSSPRDGGSGRDKLAGAALQFRLQADRAALLLTGDFAAALEAILKASRSLDALNHIQTKGLAAALDASALSPDDALRLSSLAAFAVQQLPSQQ